MNTQTADTSLVSALLDRMLDRHEKVLEPAELMVLTDAARDSGLVEDLDVDSLRAIASMNGGVAFHLHRLNLAARLQRRLGLSESRRVTAVSLTGHYGLGRQALPKVLGGRDLDETDTALLQDYFDLARVRVVISGEWESLITVGFDNGDISWHHLDRADCSVDVRPNSHGFNELETTTVSAKKASKVSVNTALYAEALYRDHLGMAAIAAGLVDHSLELARAYARERRQGGHTIEDFPAVRQMLGQMSATARAATQNLAWFAAKSPTPQDFADLCAWRSSFHPACCAATNNGMQVLGGRGYMHDFGLEQLVRDANTLRVIGGTPVELSMFIAEWERA